MPTPGALVLLSGLPGTGKTTFARALAEALPHVHIESDAIRRSLNRRPDYSPAESARVFARAEAQAEAAIAAGRNAVVDATNLTPGNRRRFYRLARRYDAPLVAVRLTAPEETVHERLQAPRRGWSEATVEVYELMRDRLRPFSSPAIVVDTRYDLRPHVALVVRLVEEARA